MVRLNTLVLTLLIAVLGIAVPIAVVVTLARQQGVESEKTRAINYAWKVVEHSESTFDVFLGLVDRLSPLIVGDPCDAENLKLMEYSALASRDIKAFGYVEGNRLLCSSLNIADRTFDLGAPDFTGSVDPAMRIRTDVFIPRVGELEFVVLEKGHIAGIIQEEAPLNAVTDGEDVVLAIFGTREGKLLFENGAVDPGWLAKLPGPGATLAFRRDGYIVGVVQSEHLDFAALAAIPRKYLQRRTRELLGYLLPVGIVAAGILIWAIIFMSRHQLALPQAMKSALRHREFFLVYQPIVELATGRWVGAEALIRWRRSNGEIVSPEVFMPAAEESGLIHSITERLFELVASDVGDLFERFPGFHLSLNVSAGDIHDEGLVEQLHRLKATTGAGPGNLFVEVTERGLTRPEKAIGVIHQLRELGIPVAVDDFGTGYSSLSYIESFDLDYLKIDKFFVDNIDVEGESDTGKVLQHIVEMARSLGLQMIAEGVETEAQRDQLQQMGVQFAQGWLYSKPRRMRSLVRSLQQE